MDVPDPGKSFFSGFKLPKKPNFSKGIARAFGLAPKVTEQGGSAETTRKTQEAFQSKSPVPSGEPKGRADVAATLSVGATTPDKAAKVFGETLQAAASSGTINERDQTKQFEKLDRILDTWVKKSSGEQKQRESLKDRIKDCFLEPEKQLSLEGIGELNDYPDLAKDFPILDGKIKEARENQLNQAIDNLYWWVEYSPEGEKDARETAKRKIEACLRGETKVLDLQGLSFSDKPSIPGRSDLEKVMDKTINESQNAKSWWEIGTESLAGFFGRDTRDAAGEVGGISSPVITPAVKTREKVDVGITNYGNTCFMNAPLQLFAHSNTFSKAISGIEAIQNQRREFLARIESRIATIGTTPLSKDELLTINECCKRFDLKLGSNNQLESLEFYITDVEKMKEIPNYPKDRISKLQGLERKLKEVKLRLESHPKIPDKEWNQLCKDYNAERAEAYNADKFFAGGRLKIKEDKYDITSLEKLQTQLELQIGFVADFEKIINKLHRQENLTKEDINSISGHFLTYKNTSQLQAGGQMDAMEFCDVIFKLIIDNFSNENSTLITALDSKIDANPGMNVLPVPENKMKSKEVTIQELIEKSREPALTYVSSESKNLFFQFPRTGVDDEGQPLKMNHSLSDIKADGTVVLPAYDKTLPKPRIREKTYRFVSAVIHRGVGIQQGHYILVNRTSEGKYFIYDDEEVKELSEKDALEIVRGQGCFYQFTEDNLAEASVQPLNIPREGVFRAGAASESPVSSKDDKDILLESLLTEIFNKRDLAERVKNEILQNPERIIEEMKKQEAFMNAMITAKRSDQIIRVINFITTKFLAKSGVDSPETAAGQKDTKVSKAGVSSAKPIDQKDAVLRRLFIGVLNKIQNNRDYAQFANKARELRDNPERLIAEMKKDGNLMSRITEEATSEDDREFELITFIMQFLSSDNQLDVEDVKKSPQFVLQPESLETLSEKYQSNQKNVLLELNKNGIQCTMGSKEIVKTGPIKAILRVRGDGDCYFRSVFVSILTQITSDSNIESRNKKIDCLLEKLRSVISLDIFVVDDPTKNYSNTQDSSCSAFIERLEELKRDGNIEKFFEDLSRPDLDKTDDPKKSPPCKSDLDRGMVILARKIMISEIGRRKGDVLLSGITIEEACAPSYSSLDGYLNTCCQMGAYAEGVGVELGVIPEYLGCKEQLLVRCGTEDANLTVGGQKPSVDSPLKDISVKVLLSGVHYNTYLT